MENGSVRSSFATTINVLEGLLAHELATGGTAESIAARRRGEEYLLERKLVRRKSTGEVVNPAWLQFSFPTRWHYDVLRALEYFRSVGGVPDPRMNEAIDLLRSKKRPDGTWLLENTHPGKVHFTLADGDGQPSRWNTLRALRVLHWQEQSLHEPSSGLVRSLALQDPADGLMDAGDPKQAQEANDRSLADDGEVIDHKGNARAHHGCLNQIGHAHTITSSIVTAPHDAAPLTDPSEATSWGKALSTFWRDASLPNSYFNKQQNGIGGVVSRTVLTAHPQSLVRRTQNDLLKAYGNA